MVAVGVPVRGLAASGSEKPLVERAWCSSRSSCGTSVVPDRIASSKALLVGAQDDIRPFDQAFPDRGVDRRGPYSWRLSEHATGNALDLAGLRLDDGRDLSLAGKDAATRSMREGVRTSACARFKTVLGPGSDASHKDHLHLDMRQRPRDYRICQWTIE